MICHLKSLGKMYWLELAQFISVFLVVLWFLKFPMPPFIVPRAVLLGQLGDHLGCIVHGKGGRGKRPKRGTLPKAMVPLKLLPQFQPFSELAFFLEPALWLVKTQEVQSFCMFMDNYTITKISEKKFEYLTHPWHLPRILPPIYFMCQGCKTDKEVVFNGKKGDNF